MKLMKTKRMKPMLIMMADGDPICKRHIAIIDTYATHISWDEDEWDEEGPVIMMGKIVELRKALKDDYEDDIEYEVFVEDVKRFKW